MNHKEIQITTAVLFFTVFMISGGIAIGINYYDLVLPNTGIIAIIGMVSFSGLLLTLNNHDEAVRKKWFARLEWEKSQSPT